MKTLTSIAAALLLVAAAGIGFFLVSVGDRKAAPTNNAEVVAEPTATTSAAQNEDCPHGLKTAECGFCTPSLNETMGYCRGHDVSEALCWVCNPKVIVAYKALDDWCAGHEVPESRCTICLASGCGAEDENTDEAQVASAAPPAKRDKNVADPDRLLTPPDPNCLINQTVVELKNADIAAAADLATEPVAAREVTPTATCNAVTAYNANLFAKLAPRVSGVVHSVFVDLGARVEQGQQLALVDSPELATAKAEYLNTRALVSLYETSHERYLGLQRKGLTTELEIHESMTKLAEGRIAESRAKSRLRALGLSEADIEKVITEDDVSSLLSITSPFAGTIVERDAVVGEVVDRQMPLFAIADTSTMWAMLDWPNADAPIAPGNPVFLRIDGLPNRVFEGRVTWVSPSADARTRTLHARAEFANDDGMLRANLFGSAEVRAQAPQSRLLVPRSAVQWDGTCNVVFVQNAPAQFYAQPVELREADPDYVEAVSGLSAGQQVVTRGAFLLKTEILKGEIGAGCCPTD